MHIVFRGDGGHRVEGNSVNNEVWLLEHVPSDRKPTSDRVAYRVRLDSPNSPLFRSL